ncbi:VOC family protein [Streptomyces bacillaris]|uniref:VOC family protein n=1 Tax=Streptomyces TaxID=1883 RepID=UPI00081B8648|nr:MULTISPECIES: VOC family protein [Streptomyces]MBT3073115.1 VOC family protein [Streptomyces sp. COG21]MBT3081519.1 VOC family protein [Streptomyces sp. COG20]MBT3085309.1 VOC family protein [Streptomyces sp. CYG21]MBT3096864.1 VOC family protein [Streptomyces sp. CBG30]MBT3105445.1 VOC family protein [Streptomyces sp. COG19]
MLNPAFPDGAPNWVDLGTPDLDGALAFYGGLFGWELLPGGPEVGGYGMFTLEGHTVAGVMTVPEEQSSSAWSVYFQSSDVSSTAQLVNQAGGRLAFEPMEVLDYGRMGGFLDPGGAYFGVWQPRQNPGVGMIQQPGSLLWVELYTPDVPAASRFFGDVFRWKTEPLKVEGTEYVYTTVHPAGTGPELSFGGLVTMSDVPAEAARGPHWLPYFEVEDVEGAVAAAKRLGGAEALPPMEVPGVGTMANVTDPYGAVFALMKPQPRQGGEGGAPGD